MKRISLTFTIFLTCLTIYSTTLPLRGRWASFAVGRATAPGYSTSSAPIDATTNRQVQRHEQEIKKLQNKASKVEKNKSLSPEEKQRQLSDIQTKTQTHEANINDLLKELK